MALLHKGSLVQTRFKSMCLLNAWKGWGRLSVTGIQPLVKQPCACTCGSLPTDAYLVDVTCKPTEPAGPIMSSPYWRLPSLPSPLSLAGAKHRFTLAMRCHSQLARPHALFDAERVSKAKKSVRNHQAKLVKRGLRGEMFEIIFSCKILSRFFPFYSQTFCRF